MLHTEREGWQYDAGSEAVTPVRDPSFLTRRSLRPLSRTGRRLDGPETVADALGTVIIATKKEAR